MTDRDVAKFIEEFHVPLHVRRHCAAVANFALSLGEKLKAKGIAINLTLLRHAALLHDMVRVVDFREFDPSRFPDPAKEKDIAMWTKLREQYKGLHHAEAAVRILEERGFPDVARLVRCHRFLQIREGFDSWEEKLLYYADKRVKHETVVSLKQRLEDGRQRNAPETKGTAEAEALDEKVYALEQEILTQIGETL